MVSKDVSALLAKEFVEIEIDVDRDVGGAETKKRYCPKEGGIPWFAFLDADGKALATSDGPGGNVGFPYQPDEVAHFVSMLRACRRNLAEDDIAMIARSIDELRAADEARRKAAEEAKKKAAAEEKARAKG